MDRATIVKLVAVAGGGVGLYYANKRYKWKMPGTVAGALGAGVGLTLGQLIAGWLGNGNGVVAAPVAQQQVAAQQQGYGGPVRYLPPAQAHPGNGVGRRMTADDLLADLGPLEGSFADIDNDSDEG